MRLDYIFEVKEYSRRRQILDSKGITYQEYLKSPLWAKAKERVYQQQGSFCRVCKTTKRLDVHHNNYNERNLSGNIRALTILCRDCHSFVHRIARQKNWPYFKIVKMLKRSYKKYGSLDKWEKRLEKMINPP